MRIAMWSGPRNLSTAMMYSFASRDDCVVVDEPFYASYLYKTGLDHPMRDEILAGQSQDFEHVISEITGDHTTPIFYQKHMTQHMIDGVSRDWLSKMTNVFLIRHPIRVVSSFAAKFEAPGLEDIGFVQQTELFDQVVASGGRPIVIDSADILKDPRAALQLLCGAIGIDWQEEMLHWAKGGRSEDGIWAHHWYESVHNSTGFSESRNIDLPEVSNDYLILAEEALPHYQHLEQYKISV